MYGFSFKFSLKKLLIAAAFIAAAVAVIIMLCGGGEKGIYAQTEQERLDYICSLGYSPQKTGGETTVVTIPYEFSKVYDEYNRIQLKAGFDLAKYKGCDVIRYTYLLEDFPPEDYAVVNLLILEGEIIGGDVSSRRLDGFMYPLLQKQDGQIG